MDIIERDPVRVVGIEVVASWKELWTHVPAAWTRLRTRVGEIRDRTDERLVDFSTARGEGIYREVVGAIVETDGAVPEGMVGVVVPGGRWLHHRHEGPAAEIAASFGRMLDWLTDQPYEPNAHKLDVGYTLGGDESVHDLYVGLDSANDRTA